VPGKAARLELEDDDALAFDFFLADRLRMTVAEMRSRVSHAEWVYWSRYHQMIADRREVASK
jgi:hypothetical protein